jgi:hypothetical protein
MEKELRKLIRKWRKQAKVSVFDEIYCEVLENCAKELSQVLKSSQHGCTLTSSNTGDFLYTVSGEKIEEFPY